MDPIILRRHCLQIGRNYQFKLKILDFDDAKFIQCRIFFHSVVCNIWNLSSIKFFRHFAASKFIFPEYFLDFGKFMEFYSNFINLKSRNVRFPSLFPSSSRAHSEWNCVFLRFFDVTNTVGYQWKMCNWKYSEKVK